MYIDFIIFVDFFSCARYKNNRNSLIIYDKKVYIYPINIKSTVETRKDKCMFRSVFFNLFILTSFLSFISCNNESGVVHPEVQYGSISGKIIHPDNNLLIIVSSEDGADSGTRNNESQMFAFDRIKYGKCILQVLADGYGLFEEFIRLDKPVFICRDIVLAKVPRQISYIIPSSDIYLDSLYFSIYSTSITDSGFWSYINFNDIMDTASVNKALTILPDTAGVQTEWALNRSLSVFFPYWKLSTNDTVKVTIGRKALNRWNDTLDHDCTVFYPVDTNFIRTTWLKKSGM